MVSFRKKLKKRLLWRARFCTVDRCLMMVILGTSLNGKWSAFALTRGSCNSVGRPEINLVSCVEERRQKWRRISATLTLG